MAGNLGSMILELSANTARFQSDMGKAAYIAQQNAEKMQRTIQGAVDGISKSLGDIAGGLVAAFSVDRLIEFGKRAIDAADEMGKMAQKVGVSTEALSAFQVQAKLSDVATDQLQAGLSKLAKAAADAAGGSKQQAAAFEAIGVSVKDAAGNLRPMAELVQDVSKKFAGYADSASKTALAQEFFGKSGAELIPFLNELGEKSLPQVIAQAEQFGAVISGDTAKAAEHFNDNLTSLGIEAQGFATAVVSKLLPSMNALTDEMVDAGKTTDGYSSSAEGAANAVKSVALVVLTAKEVISAASTTVFAFYDAVKTTFDAAGEIIAAWASATGKAINAAFHFDKAGLDAADAEFSARVKKTAETFKASMAGIKEGLTGGVGDAVDRASSAYSALFEAVGKVGSAVESTNKKLDPAPIVANAAAADAAAKKAQKIAADYLDMQKVLDGLAGKLGGPYDKAWSDYASAIDQAAKAAAKYKADGVAIADIQKFIAEATDLATQHFREQTDATFVLDGVFNKINQTYAQQNALIGLTGEALQIETEYQKLLNEALKEMDAVMGPLTEEQQRRIESLHGMAAAQVELTNTANLNTEAAKGWQQIWAQAGDGVASTFAKVLVSGGSLFKGLKDLAKQTVQAIIEYFAKLAVINPILNAIFGGSVGFSLLPSLANAAGGSALSGSAGSILNANGSGGSFDIFSAASWTSAGKNLFSGFSSLWNGQQGGLSGISSNMFGTTINDSGAYTWTPSMLGSALTIGGGLLAAYGEFKNAGGGFKGTVAGAAYGVGTITAAGAVAGIASGAGAAAGAAGALGTVGLGAIPVVGWIALAAMIVDKISGGKLFGTSANKFQGGTQTETISAAGGNVTNIGTFKGQRALFGGSYYKDKSLPVDPASQKAADDFFAALKKGTTDFAKSFGMDAADIVGGVFKTTFDKNGKVTGTSSTVLGVTRTGETGEQFAQRLQADSFLAVLDKMGLGASAFVAGMQDDADKLFAAVQDFAQATTLANTDLGNGFHFLALSSNATLVDVIKFTEGLQAAGETLTQTYARLAQAQQQYNQFVAQFAPGTMYVDDFEAAFSQLYHQMLQNIDAANKLAIAAGATGAAQEDLVNIQRVAAQQMAQLVNQLQSSAQQLAFSLGLTTKGSLDQVNAEIERLQNLATSSDTTTSAVDEASKATRSFGNAVGAVAKQTNDAVNLLLGNLSPLNDQQKLQIALQGLRAGTVSQEQVLTIGRNLYASSQAYSDLFAQVQQYGGKAGGGSAWKGSPGVIIGSYKAAAATTTTGSGLSDADQKRLDDLIKQRDLLQASQTMQQYQTLAQQIAEIATAKGEDFAKVLDEMGIQQKDLEKGLKLDSDAALRSYIETIQKQQDSAKENTQSIIEAINALPQALAAIFDKVAPGNRAFPLQPAPGQPTPSAPPDVGPPSTGPIRDGGRRGSSLPGSRNITDADAEAIAKASMAAFAPYYAKATADTSRSGRGVVLIR